MSRFTSILLKLVASAWVGIVIACGLQTQWFPQIRDITMPFLALGTLISSAIMAALNRLTTNNDPKCLIYDCEESDRYIIAAAKTLQANEVEAWFRHVIKTYLTDEGDEVWVLVHGTIIPLTYDDRDNLRAVMKLYKQAQAVLAEAPPKKQGQPKLGGAAPGQIQHNPHAQQWQNYYLQMLASGNQAAAQQAAQTMYQHGIPIPPSPIPNWY
jgi:hypothetical protein